MTKKQFNALAEQLAKVRREHVDPSLDFTTVDHVWIQCVEAVVRVCEEDNEKFDGMRFRRECNK